MGRSLTDKQRGKLVLTLLEKNLYQAGLAFELDKHYKDADAVKNAVYRYYQLARKAPERYGLTVETVEEIAAKMQSRQLATIRAEGKSLREKEDAEANKDIKELIQNGRKKAFQLVMKKLDRISRTKKALDDTNLSTLATTFGIIFDKSQIIQGEATENVAVMAKINKDLSPEAAISAVLKMREVHQAEKERTNKKK